MVETGTREALARRDRIHGWLIVAACFGLTLTLGETFWTFGVFFKPIQQEFGWTRAMVSSIFTAFLLGYAVSVVAGGRLVDRFRPEPLLVGSALLIVSGLCLCSVGASLNQFLLLLFIVGLGSGATWAVPNTIVQRRFHGKPHAGLALGVVISGVGVGALVFAPLIDYLIRHHGWRTTFLVLGALFGLVIGAATLVLRGVPGAVEAGRQAGVRRGTGGRAAPPSRIYATRAFAATVFVIVAGVFTFQVIAAHMIPHVTDAGISSAAAAGALGLMGGTSIPGRLLSGVLSARLGWHRMLSLAYFGTALSIMCLWWLKDIWMLYLFAVAYGLFHGMRVAAQVGVIPGIFGMQSLGELIGITTATAQVISALAPYAAGALFDAASSYSIGFGSIVALLTVGGIVAGALNRFSIAPDRPDTLTGS